jgi:nucleotide-binding universal stress UspA family protein
MYNKILVPLDGSERAEKILPHVEELARLYDAKVIFLRVLECPPAVSGIVGSSFDEALCHQKLQRRKKEALSYLATWQDKFHEKGIDVRTHLGDGRIVEAIIDTAEREGADLIALTSHGRTGLSRVFYGSVAAGVLHRADRPLLLIRSQSHPQGTDQHAPRLSSRIPRRTRR